MPTLPASTHGNELLKPQLKRGELYLGATADEALVDGGLCQLLGCHCFRGTLQHLRTSHVTKLTRQVKILDLIEALILLMLKSIHCNAT